MPPTKAAYKIVFINTTNSLTLFINTFPLIHGSIIPIVKRLKQGPAEMALTLVVSYKAMTIITENYS